MKNFPFILLLVALSLAACSGGPPPTPTPAEMLVKAGDAVLALKSAQFALTREGPAAVLDAKTNLKFTEATGQYQAPDRVSAKVKVDLLGNVVEIEARWLPEGNFVSNPLTKQFQAMPADVAFNGAALFQAEGIPAVFKGGIQNPKLVGEEKIEDVDTYHFSGEADGKVLASLTAGALTEGTLYPVDVWIDKATSNLVRVHITEPENNGWLIDMFSVNEPVEIKAP